MLDAIMAVSGGKAPRRWLSVYIRQAIAMALKVDGVIYWVQLFGR